MINWEKIFATYITDKGRVCLFVKFSYKLLRIKTNINQVYLNLKKKRMKTNSPREKWSKDMYQEFTEKGI